MGGGDIKMMAMVGAFVGWQGVLLTIFLGAFFGSLIFLPLLLVGHKKLVPFGIFLSIGAATAYLVGPRMVHWYARFSPAHEDAAGRGDLATAAVILACRGQAPGDPRPDALSRLVDSLKAPVERATGLEFKTSPKSALRSRKQVRDYLIRKLDEELPPAKLQGLETAYRLFGLLPDTLTLRSLLLDLYTEQVAGYYDPDSATLFGVQGADPSQLRLVLAHEMVHALQGQYLAARFDPPYHFEQRPAHRGPGRTRGTGHAGLDQCPGLGPERVRQSGVLGHVSGAGTGAAGLDAGLCQGAADRARGPDLSLSGGGGVHALVGDLRLEGLGARTGPACRSQPSRFSSPTATPAVMCPWHLAFPAGFRRGVRRRAR